MRSRGWMIAALAAAMALAPGGWAAAEPEPGIVRSGNLVWVSVDYLRAHPDALPGVELRDDTPYFEAASVGRCDRQTCIKLEGDGVFVDRFSTTYYSSGSEGPKHAHFLWTLAGSGTPRSMYHYDVAPSVADTGKPGVYCDTQGLTGAFAAGLTACAEWIPCSGVPCADIKR